MLLLVAVGVLSASACNTADLYPRRIPIGVDGAHPLRVYNLWPLSAYGSGNPPKPIALTFDDGPSATTNAIVSVLASRHVTATFFEVTSMIPGREAIVQNILANGDRIGSHSVDHPDLTAIPFSRLVREVEDSKATLSRFLPADDGVRCLRPPYGANNQTVVNLDAANGMATIIWDVDPEDWKNPAPNDIYNRVVRAAHPGAIVGMHDGGGNRANTAAALGAIIDTLEQQGYTFVSIC